MHTETTKHKQPSEVHELYGHYSRNDRCAPVEQIWHLREGIRVYKGCGHTHRHEFIFRPSSQRDSASTRRVMHKVWWRQIAMATEEMVKHGWCNFQMEELGGTKKTDSTLHLSLSW